MEEELRAWRDEGHLTARHTIGRDGGYRVRDSGRVGAGTRAVTAVGLRISSGEDTHRVAAMSSGADDGSKRPWARKWGLLQANWSYQSRQFFEKSTLHGVRYIAEKRTPLHERVLWFISTTGGLIAALVIIDSLWDKFQNSPTITGLDTDYHSWDVPFPGLTLCLQNPANETLVEDYVNEKWPNSNANEKMYYSKYLNILTNMSFVGLPSLLPFVGDKSLPQTGLRELSFRLYNHCHIFTQCAYKQGIEDDPKDCCTLLHPVFTENGFCFAFNHNYSAADWPWKTESPPFSEDLIEETDSRWSFTFDADDPLNNSVSVYITSSFDLPGADINPQHIWNKRVSKLMFVPKMTYTAEGADQLSMRQRGCVFKHEIKLRVAPFYTFSSCMRQCRMDTLVKQCGCLPMFYTLLRGQRYCNLSEMKCIIESLDKLSSLKLKCPCQLGCEHTVYDMEKPHEAGGEAGGEGQDAVGLEVGFLSWPLTRYKRDVLFGQVDLLVAIGTIAGLFLGFSLLSGLEIIYLFTMRAWCMMYTDRQHLEDLAQEYSKKESEPVNLALRPGFMQHKDAEAGVLAVAPVPSGAEAGADQQGPPLWNHNSPVAAKNAMNAQPIFPYMH